MSRGTKEKAVGMGLEQDISSSVEAAVALVARRLEAIMRDTGLQTVQALADEIGAKRSQVSNWLQGYHLPPVQYMGILCKKKGLTLDWIYLGDPAGLSYAAAIRLAGILEGLPPQHIEEDLPPVPSVDVKALAKAPRKASAKVSAKAR